jgi:SAM-dependent methyltransferase
MKTLDRFLQHWRLRMVRPYLRPGARVLDVGCADGALFKYYAPHIREMVGIDPTLHESVDMENCKLIAGQFPDNLPDSGRFDAITMLAVLEHVPVDQQVSWAGACSHLLAPGGYLIITAPSPIVDRILAVLKGFRLIDGMSLEEHYGFDPRAIPALFSVDDLQLVTAKRFQLGCNNFFVFRKADGNGRH